MQRDGEPVPGQLHRAERPDRIRRHHPDVVSRVVVGKPAVVVLGHALGSFSGARLDNVCRYRNLGGDTVHPYTRDPG